MSEIEDRVSQLEKGKEFQDIISQGHQRCVENQQRCIDNHQICVVNHQTSIEALNTTCRNLNTAVTAIIVSGAGILATFVCLWIKLGN